MLQSIHKGTQFHQTLVLHKFHIILTLRATTRKLFQSDDFQVLKNACKQTRADLPNKNIN